MALDPVFLDRVPNSAVSLWQQCEDDILRDMARKIKSADYYVPAAQWQETRLRASGMQRRQIVKTLAKYSGKSEAHIQQLMQKAGQASVHNDLNGLKHSQVYRVTDVDKQALNAILRSGAMQTNQTMKNICATTANTATKQFENALDRAWMQVSSGAFDTDTAVQRACRDLADKGIAAIDYGGHVDTIETAVRRAVRTGVNQTALRLSEEICDELGCDLVEVTAHEGARPDHAVWQGQIYSRSGKNPKYKSFVSATGYGTGAGLGGWNCRHSFGPYVEGSARVWTDEKLAALNEKEFNYGGVDMTRYEATQYQRSLERQLRKAKRRQMAGVEGAQQQIDVANAQLDDFCKATGLKRQYQLDDVTGWSGTYNPVNTVPVKAPKVPRVTVNVNQQATKTANARDILKLSDCKDFDELGKFMSDKYGIKVESDVYGLDFDTVRDTLVGVTDACDTLPGLKGSIKKVCTTKSGVMGCSGETVSFNPAWFEVGSNKLRENCVEFSESGWWPKNSTLASISYHECGHAFEWITILESPSNSSRFDMIDSWNKCTYAQIAVSEACKEAKRLPEYKGKRNEEIKRSISRYATSNASETMAEAFADVYVNGENAQTISKLIFRNCINQYNGFVSSK